MVAPANAPGGYSGMGGMLTEEALRPGQRLGRYTLLMPVAQGGMARVWAARQAGMRGFQKLVAIKTIVPALAADPEFEKMFLDEARIAAAIHHPNVCEIHDLGEEGSVLFLAMEWVDGVALLSLLKARPKSPLPDAIAVRIIAGACAGIHGAHELRNERGELMGLVHRDVSPHNVMVGLNGTVKMTDFGVAKAMGLDHAPTVAGQLKGKVAYMSPEQAVGDTSVDRRSDVFSLGAVLYEAVTGHRAWTGANDVARLQNLLQGNIVPPRHVRPDIPQDLEAILDYALAMDPARRFQTAEQMRVALEQFLMSRNIIVTAGDVGDLVNTLVGQELEDRRARLRHASNAVIEEEGAASQGSASIGGIAMHPAKGRGMRRSTATAISFLGGGITIAGVLGIIAIESMPMPRAPVAARPSAAPTVPPAPPAPDEILVNPKPSTAIVLVNGVIAGSGNQRLRRPKSGQKVKITVRDNAHHPKEFTVDSESQPVWNVELVPVASASATPTKPPATRPPRIERPPSWRGGGAKKPPPEEEKPPSDLPTNPY